MLLFPPVGCSSGPIAPAGMAAALPGVPAVSSPPKRGSRIKRVRRRHPRTETVTPVGIPAPEPLKSGFRPALRAALTEANNSPPGEQQREEHRTEAHRHLVGCAQQCPPVRKDGPSGCRDVCGPHPARTRRPHGSYLCLKLLRRDRNTDSWSGDRLLTSASFSLDCCI